MHATLECLDLLECPIISETEWHRGRHRDCGSNEFSRDYVVHDCVACIRYTVMQHTRGMRGNLN
jgi:hypothetical protein